MKVVDKSDKTPCIFMSKALEKNRRKKTTKCLIVKNSDKFCS